MHLNHYSHWVFDLDNTLYSAKTKLFDQVSEKITQFIQDHFTCRREEAKAIQKSYVTQYGTTLNGLMKLQDIDPEEYLNFVHDIDLSNIEYSPGLVDLIAQLPGKKYIFTNADTPYARRVIDKLGMDGLFDDICDICACEYQPKPKIEAYYSLLEKTDIDPLQAVFFEDMARNLEPAKSLGMQTVWINNGFDWGAIDKGDHIDHEIDDLEYFLKELVENN